MVQKELLHVLSAEQDHIPSYYEPDVTIPSTCPRSRHFWDTKN